MKIGIKFIFITFIFFILNCFSYGFIYFKTNLNMYSQQYKDFKKRYSKSEEKTVYPHPFYGYGNSKNFNYKNKLGNDYEPLFLKIPNFINSRDVKILILGGSVATHLSLNDSEDQFFINDLKFYKNDIFQKTLNQNFNTSNFKVFNAAIPGGKQPQQLFVLNYLTLHGFKFDIVINLDGFNELALSFSENLPIKNNIIYPRQYSTQLAAFNSDIKCVKKSNSSIHSSNVFPLIELFNLYQIYSCHKKIYGIGESKINETFSKLTGFKNEPYNLNLDQIIKLWENSSQMIEDLSKVYNFDYIHVLQPNQYLKNSKILTDYEKSISNFKKYKYPIENYYNNFNLNNINLSYKLDARKIFQYNQDNLYRDYCCHLNNKGMYLLSLKIVNSF